MGLSEFDIISRFFNQPGLAADPLKHSAVSLGIGDDCAVLQIPAGQQLLLSMDVLVEDVHFPGSADPGEIARRALAVNLSDLAAMGAAPLGFMLGLTLPHADETWLAGFSAGLKASAGEYACPLLGGNLARGPLQIAIQVQGTVPSGQALTRSGARVGDLVYVSGSLGTAGLGLQLVLGKLNGLEEGDRQTLLDAYYRPRPRLALGIALRGLASAALDISDGLLGDAAHLAHSSGLQVQLESGKLPLAPVMNRLLDQQLACELALTAGDDYELLFTVPAHRAGELDQVATLTGVNLSLIGKCLPGTGVVLGDGLAGPEQGGFDHFRYSSKT